MKQLPDVPAWFIEFVQRLFKKSPRFFRVLNAVTGIITVVLGAIPAITLICSWFNIIIPPEWSAYSDAAVAKLTLVAYITGKLAVDRPVVIDTTTPKELPFTVKKEIEKQNNTQS